MKAMMEQAWANRSDYDGTDDGGNYASCVAPSACADRLEDPFCDVQFGSTTGCQCKGRAVDDKSYVVKASSLVGTSDASVRSVVCAANKFKSELPKMYYDLVETGDTKWIYYGATSGSLLVFPGFLWPRDDNEGCGATYDPRRRPWMMSAATGNMTYYLSTHYQQWHMNVNPWSSLACPYPVTQSPGQHIHKRLWVSSTAARCVKH